MSREGEVRQMLAFGREQSGVEFKGAGLRSEKPFLAKVVRAALSMANRRDGGVVLVGVADGDPTGGAGLAPDQLAQWMDFDAVSAAFANYCDPPLDFTLEQFDNNGRPIVCVTVGEFRDVPIICKKSYPGVLRDGAIYVRSRHKVESAELPSQTEMRDLIDLATEKRLRAFVEQSHRSGVALSPSPPTVTDAEKFTAQLGGL